MAGGLRVMAAELFRWRDLLYLITLRDVKLKYKQTVMGFLWAILMPLVIVSAGLIVRRRSACRRAASSRVLKGLVR